MGGAPLYLLQLEKLLHFLFAVQHKKLKMKCGCQYERGKMLGSFNRFYRKNCHYWWIQRQYSFELESYKVAADQWCLMPSMFDTRAKHSLVVVENKLFVLHTYVRFLATIRNNLLLKNDIVLREEYMSNFFCLLC